MVKKSFRKFSGAKQTAKFNYSIYHIAVNWKHYYNLHLHSENFKQDWEHKIAMGFCDNLCISADSQTNYQLTRANKTQGCFTKCCANYCSWSWSLSVNCNGNNSSSSFRFYSKYARTILLEANVNSFENTLTAEYLEIK